MYLAVFKENIIVEFTGLLQLHFAALSVVSLVGKKRKQEDT